MQWMNAIGRRLRPHPLEWRAGARRPMAERPSAVDVIIPIHGAAEALRSCLASVAAHTDLTRHRLLLVLDGPQDSAVEALVAAFAAAHGPAVTILRNEQRVGFAGTANRGLAASRSDVVLLNSDTIVTERWLEKLIDAAATCGDVGTVTPLSNHATLCSVPRAFEENLLPAGYDVAAFAALVERVSRRSYPPIPTGVGYCLYIRRALLDAIGLFDEARFPRYGEENDFCMRALARGWLHLADDATFVYHAGHRSFGAARTRLQRRAAATLTRLHPRYMATIAESMRIDPLADVRARILSALRGSAATSPTKPEPGTPKPGPLRIVHLVHGWPPFQHAGTELYAYWLVHRQRQEHHVAVYARADDRTRGEGEAVEYVDRGVRVRLVTNNFTARNPLRRNAIGDGALERDFERFLRSEAPQLLHVHHLAGHAFSLVRVARRLGIPVLMQIQDWWFVCARVNRLDAGGQRCSGPAPAKCARCATLTRIPPKTLTNRLLHVLRRRAARAALRACDAFVAGSKSIRDDYAAVVPRSTPFHVIPYGVAIERESLSRPPARRPIRFGCIGSVAPHKGIHVAVAAMRDFDPSAATLHVWGDAGAFPEYVAGMKHGPGVVFAGPFREEEKPRVFASLDVLLVPSIGLESFGLAAREAMACGVPVIASAGGALSEMFEPGLCGDFFPAGDAAALGSILRRVVEEPAIIDRWAEHLPETIRDDAHAIEMDRLYRSVLADDAP